ncbi:MAG: thiamine-phosphate kinase [Candidatus Methanomethylicia archaeon]|nr:thiamine-phosphate kinase [Candidatus Methanomethylicia archaeon]MCX8169096.1 thiamine-phosphate kinase [Candidatus Methanomethylicia archaeon]MDW7988828.1 thiamine-phosphate kinase [Nitrososphaerota archaeon]
MKVSDVGEWKIIETIFEVINKKKRLALPYGDDAIALKLTRNINLVMNVDMLVGKTDVPPGMSAIQIGKKVVTMSVSDLAAKGAKPMGFLSSIGLRRDMDLEYLIEVYKGMNIAARKYNMYILGGDTNETDDLIIDGISFGIAKNVISRSGAKIGDIVAITGLFGNTSAGFKILFENLYAPQKLKNKILKDIYEPKGYVKEGIVLAKKGLVNASIDSSDGLAISLYEIAKKSNVGIEINMLPITEEAKKFAEMNNIDPLELVFYGGEEYVLILTIERTKWTKAQNEIKKIGGKLIPIGKVIEDKNVIIYKCEGKEIFIEKRGWEHFKHK